MHPNMAPPPLHVVAWLLSMTMVASGIPMGYEYPAPEVPFIEGAQVSTTPAPDCVPGDLQDNPYYTSLLDMGVPLCPSENQYDDYDPSDIPADQAAPVEDLPTYTEAPVEEYDEYDPNDIPEDQAAPATEGYNYPVPENPLTLPTRPTTTAAPLPPCVTELEEGAAEFIAQGVPLCPEELPAYTEAPVEEYDDYDPNDIPDDQAAPATEGYNYPAPENPLQLPSRARKAKVVVDKEDELTIGLTHLDTDSYDPGNYDHNSPDYIEEEEVEEEERTSEVTQQGRRTQQPGISLTGPGHVISFHVPAGHVRMVEEQRAVEEFGGERHADPFTNLLGGELIPPVLRRMKAGRKTKTSMVNTGQED